LRNLGDLDGNIRNFTEGMKVVNVMRTKEKAGLSERGKPKGKDDEDLTHLLVDFDGQTE